MQKYAPRATGIPEKIGQFPINDPAGFYFGFAASGYGIMWNERYVKANKLPDPKEWQDLAKPVYYDHVSIAAEVAGHRLDGGPALGPAFALQHRLDGQMRGAGARGRGDRDMVVIGRLGEILPLLRVRQLVGLRIALVPHDAVAGSGKAEIEPLGVVDRKLADLLGDAVAFGVYFCSRLLPLSTSKASGAEAQNRSTWLLALVSSRYFTPALVLRFWTSSVMPGTAASKAFLTGSVTSLE